MIIIPMAHGNDNSCEREQLYRLKNIEYHPAGAREREQLYQLKYILLSSSRWRTGTRTVVSTAIYYYHPAGAREREHLYQLKIYLIT